MGICHIVGAGPGEISFLQEKEDLIIAADGGYDSLMSTGIKPDWAVGDFDSISGSKTPEMENVVVFPSEKDYTDSTLAAQLGEREGYKYFIFHCCTGGDLDHTLANISELYSMVKRGLRAVMRDGDNCLCAVKNGKIEFTEKAHGKISILSLSESSERVNLRGLKYGLQNYRMTSDYALGVRNEFTGSAASVSVGEGALLLHTAFENILSFSDYFTDCRA